MTNQTPLRPLRYTVLKMIRFTQGTWDLLEEIAKKETTFIATVKKPKSASELVRDLVNEALKAREKK